MSKRELKGLGEALSEHLREYLRNPVVRKLIGYTERVEIRVRGEQHGPKVTFTIFSPKKRPVFLMPLTAADKKKIGNAKKHLYRPEVMYILDHGEASGAELRSINGLEPDAPYRLQTYRINGRFAMIGLTQYKVQQVGPTVSGRSPQACWSIFRTIPA